MDALSALILTDDDSQSCKAGEGGLYRVLGGYRPVAVAVALEAVKDVSMEWRVTNTPSLSTQYERELVKSLNEMQWLHNNANELRSLEKATASMIKD